MSKRYFLNNFDTYFGSSFLPLLFPEGPPSEPTLLATYKDVSQIDKPAGFKKILKREKPKLFRKRMFEECDVFIYDLHNSDDEDLSFIFEALKATNFEEQKLFLLISNVMTWGRSERKVKIEEEEKKELKENDNPDVPAEDMKNDSMEAPHSEILELDPSIDPPLSPSPPSFHSLPPIYLPFTDSDYKDRVALEGFEREKEWEDRFLGLSKENLKVCVICAGVVYGEGEVVFKKYLESAWKANPSALPYPLPGTNVLPTIHIADLAKFVLKIAESGGRQSEDKKNDYFLAIDKTGQKKLKELEEKEAEKKLEAENNMNNNNNHIEPEIKMESEENKLEGEEVSGVKENEEEDFGKEKLEEIESIPPPIQTGYGRWLCEIFSDLAIKVGNGVVEGVEEIMEEWGPKEVFGIDLDMRGSEELWGEEFEWRAEGGMGENARKVMEEFEKKMKLRPIKILIYCKSESKREMKFSTVLDEIAQHYKIPILSINNILQRALQEADSELIRDLEEEIENIQVYLDLNKAENLNETLKVLYRTVKWRLGQNDCRNRGYILDDFPRFAEEAKFIFEKTKSLKRKKKKPAKLPPTSQDENNNAEALDEAVLEDNIDEQEKLEEEEEEAQPEEEQLEEGEEGQIKKEEVFFPESVIVLREFNGTNRDSSVNCNAIDYLETKKIDVFLYDSSRKPDFETFESLRLYIERNGTPFNYLTPDSELTQRHIDYYLAKNTDLEDMKAVHAEEEEKLKQEAISKREKAALEQVKFILENEFTQNKNMHFREYLMEYIIPHVSSGLLEVSEYQPDDPIEFLSEYIYKKSFDI